MRCPATTMGGEAGGDRGDVVIELRPGQRAPLRTRLDQRRTVRGASGVTGDQISEILGSRAPDSAHGISGLVFGHFPGSLARLSWGS